MSNENQPIEDDDDLAATGCCVITFNGAVNTFSGITERECIEQCNEMPGATYTFTEGEDCDD